MVDEHALLVAIPTLKGRTEPFKSVLYFGTIPETVRDMPVDYHDDSWREKIPRRFQVAPASANDSPPCPAPVEMQFKLEVQPEDVRQVDDVRDQQGCQCVIM